MKLAYVGVWPPLQAGDARLALLDWVAEAEAMGAAWPEIAQALQQQGWEKYSPDQPRVPAGQPEGGEWTNGGGGGSSSGHFFGVRGYRDLIARLREWKSDEVWPKDSQPGSALSEAWDHVNPGQGEDNCVDIAKAIVARLTGRDRTATAPNSGRQDTDQALSDLGVGSRRQMGTMSLDQAFEKISKEGDGAIGVVLFSREYHDAQGNLSEEGHMVIIANDRGVVRIIEGQKGGGINENPGLLTQTQANARYRFIQGTTTPPKVRFALLPQSIQRKP